MTTSSNMPNGGAGPSPLDPAFLDGHTVEELSDYLDRGRIPRDPSIESSPGAQNALAALSRLRSIAPQILESEANARDSKDDSWIKRILEQIGVQAHAGRDIPISHENPAARLSISEGAVRSLIREVGDELDGMIVEKTTLDGDVESAGAPIVVSVEVSIFADFDRDEVTRAFRDGVRAALRLHSELHVEAVEVYVQSDDLTEDDRS